MSWNRNRSERYERNQQDVPTKGGIIYQKTAEVPFHHAATCTKLARGLVIGMAVGVGIIAMGGLGALTAGATLATTGVGAAISRRRRGCYGADIRAYDEFGIVAGGHVNQPYSSRLSPRSGMSVRY